MRYALNRLAVVAPTWLRAHMQPAWLERYGNRVENYRFPKADAERQQLAATIGADGFALLQAAYAPRPLPKSAGLLRSRSASNLGPAVLWPRGHAAGGTPDVPPAAQLIHSPTIWTRAIASSTGCRWLQGPCHRDM